MKKRPKVILGTNYDGTQTYLEPYIEDEHGVQRHPSRMNPPQPESPPITIEEAIRITTKQKRV